MNETLNAFFVECPSCATSFPVDPAKVPDGGVLARCSVCEGVFRVEKPAPEPEPVESLTLEDLATTEEAPPAGAPLDESDAAAAEATRPVFGQRDPADKARRLARVLVSDMITYNPDRHARALEAGTIAEDFDDEIKKSWAEYVDQVGQEMAEGTTFFTDALNEILAGGTPTF
jgi:predicted Zn finger-like uncharacterized protein